MAIEELELEIEELSPKEILKSEVNLLVLPFFALSNQEMRARKSTEYRAIVVKGDNKLELLWQVTGSQKWGHPGPFDKKVFRAIERIIQERGYPVANPIAFTSYELCKKMGIPLGGRQYKLIEQALVRIAAVTIKAQSAFYRKRSKDYWKGGIFHIYDEVYTQGQRLADGRIADRNFVYLNQLYLDNLNLHYVRPLDWEYYQSLKRPLSQRLYELLGVKFYGAMRHNSLSLRFNYENLCQLLPIAVKPYLSQAKQQLEPAHRELVNKKFLAGVEWDEWTIYYHAGEHAVNEIHVLSAV